MRILLKIKEEGVRKLGSLTLLDVDGEPILLLAIMLLKVTATN
jgi:hypothetical protein